MNSDISDESDPADYDNLSDMIKNKGESSLAAEEEPLSS